MKLTTPHLPLLLLAWWGPACSEAPANSGGAGGTETSGGSSSGSSNSSGSATATGGTEAIGGAPSGGAAPASGGLSASGGIAAGGSLASGGDGTGGDAAAGSGGALGSGAAPAGGSPSTGGHGGLGDGPFKLITIGDSITQSTCWRALLWESLEQDHPGRFDFVGSKQNDPNCAPTNYDKDTESYGSSLLTQAISGEFTNPAKTCNPKAESTGNCPALIDFTNAFRASVPDIALIHYGTNDIWGNTSAQAIIDGYASLIGELRAVQPQVVVLVAQIIPLAASSCAACTTTVPALNQAIATWAPMESTADSPIYVVDQFTDFDTGTDTRDGVHPNDSGSQKMAAKWKQAIDELF